MRHLLAPLMLAAAAAGPWSVAQAQLLGGVIGDTVTFSASVQTSASEVYGFPAGPRRCYPGQELVTTRVCSDADTAASTQPGETIATLSFIEPPLNTPPNARVQGDGAAFHDAQTTSRGYLKRYEASVDALSHITGPNRGDMEADANAGTGVEFAVLSLLRPTVAQLSGTLRVRATDPQQTFIEPAFQAAYPGLLLKLERVGGEIVFEASVAPVPGGEFAELAVDETLTLANGRYRLSLVTGARVIHLSAVFASIGNGKVSEAQAGGEFVLTLDNHLLRLLP